MGWLRGSYGRRQNYSIGVLTGSSWDQLSEPAAVRNPVLSAGMVSDMDAAFVADPFMIHVADEFWMFFEAMNNHSRMGEIVCAKSRTGSEWEYIGRVLREPFHLSYPLVFAVDSEVFMLPETHTAEQVRLYRSTKFPLEWKLHSVLLRGSYSDATVFRHHGLWWIFAMRGSLPAGGPLELFWSRELTTGWQRHPCSPLAADPATESRPAGRVLVSDAEVIRFAQSCVPYYGSAVRAFRVTRLTTTEFDEESVGDTPLLAGGGRSWNADGMHHVDAMMVGSLKWLACVDGWVGQGLTLPRSGQTVTRQEV